MKSITTIFCVFFTAIILQAQQVTVTGIVTDETNTPLTGVNILIKNSSKGTQTDFDGAYQLKASIGDELEFNYVGYKTVTRKVKDNKK